jgi:carbamoyl-phosphate synthase small subunit
VHVLPAHSTLEDVLAISPVALFYSNGPGDPAASGQHVELLQGALRGGLPFFGICFGNQLLGELSGLIPTNSNMGTEESTNRYLDKETGHIEITAQNHGFAVDAPARVGMVESPAGFGRVEVSHVSLNDDVVEGLESPRHTGFFSAVPSGGGSWTPRQYLPFRPV